MDWLALHLPALALEVYTRALAPRDLSPEPGSGQSSRPSGKASPPAGHPPPLAVSEHERIVARNAAAARFGIVPGLPDAAARALVAELRILPRKPAAERAALARLAAWVMAFSDRVSLAPPAALVLESGRSLRLFGGAAALRRRVLDGVTGLGWRARCVLAPTPGAALVLAAAGLGTVGDEAGGDDAAGAIIAGRDALRRSLAVLPVAALDFTAAELDDLARMGIGRLADLLRLPRAGLAERFGVARLHQLERLLGERPDPRRPFVPPARFRATLELPAEVPDAPALVFACRRLIDELGGFLLARQAGVQHLDWRLHHADGPPTRFRLGSAAPARDPAHWLNLLRERLDRLSLPAPVRAVAVSSEQIHPLAPAHAELFPRDAATAAPDPALLDRLRTRLGDDAVRGLMALPDHRPERALGFCEPQLVLTEASNGRGRSEPGRAAHGPSSLRTQPSPAPSLVPTSAPGTAATARRDRPLWLLARPLPLAARDGRPWLDGPLDLGRGCERIDTGWWDGFAVARDYYVALSADGERLWVYRELRGNRGWFLHGIFGDLSG
ncbi:MAG: DNA polymerase Y family protein [Thiohalocapsa sp.]|jgi:protein ImuB|uniref:Y-family DNA polymerase n=1 Tax=Thiohalocapsa sp. TaxID=2497641 RepID=UPI0025EBFFE8|nr:DNA polymerase Y family protein [Thiohalocapsa sp.]MCG6943247.1 DNA polymerase Y family protein [Thiohalocapsa sp.]